MDVADRFDCIQELQRAFNESRQGKEGELAQNVNMLEAADLEKSPDGDPTMQDVNWEHQVLTSQRDHKHFRVTFSRDLCVAL